MEGVEPSGLVDGELVRHRARVDCEQHGAGTGKRGEVERRPVAAGNNLGGTRESDLSLDRQQLRVDDREPTCLHQRLDLRFVQRGALPVSEPGSAQVEALHWLAANRVVGFEHLADPVVHVEKTSVRDRLLPERRGRHGELVEHHRLVVEVDDLLGRSVPRARPAASARDVSSRAPASATERRRGTRRRGRSRHSRAGAKSARASRPRSGRRPGSSARRRSCGREGESGSSFRQVAGSAGSSSTSWTLSAARSRRRGPRAGRRRRRTGVRPGTARAAPRRRRTRSTPAPTSRPGCPPRSPVGST